MIYQIKLQVKGIIVLQTVLITKSWLTMELRTNTTIHDDHDSLYDVEFYSDEENNVLVHAYKLPMHTRFMSNTFRDQQHVTLLDRVFNAIAKKNNSVKITSFGEKEIKLIVDGKFYTLVKDSTQSDISRLEHKMDFESREMNAKFDVLMQVVSSMTQQIEKLEAIISRKDNFDQL
jgi:hypothetical protein